MRTAQNLLERSMRSLLGVGLILTSFSVAQTAAAACGDGVVQQPPEQCDDGNLAIGDCCDARCQYETVGAACGLDDLCFGGDAVCDGLGTCSPSQPDCTAAAAGGIVFDAYSISLRDPGDPDKARMRFGRRRLRQLRFDALGRPDVDTRYAFCLYESEFFLENVTRVLVSGELATGSSWRQKSNAAWKYTHKSPEPGGIRRVSVTGQGWGRLRVRAGGSAFRLPGPASADAYFESPGIVVGLVGEERRCWLAGIPTTGHNTSTQFKAKRPITN